MKQISSFLQDITFLKSIKKGTVGIMGGSFSPPHEGHVYISNTAIQKLNLNMLLWLITPLNPLKDKNNLLPLQKRVHLCKKITYNIPKIKVSTLENDLNTNYTYNTIKVLTSIIPSSIKLVWVMGEDILFSLHNFYRWKDLTKLINFAIISRGGINSFMSLNQKYSHIMKMYFINSNSSNLLKVQLPPCWTFWYLPKKDISSTQIRNNINYEKTKYFI